VSEILYVKGRSFLSLKETSWHRKKPPVTRRNLQSREDTSCDRNKPPVTVRNLLSQEEISSHMKTHLKIDVQMDEQNAEEEIQIAENISLIQNAYQILRML
jgi:hypothetical protein